MNDELGHGIIIGLIYGFGAFWFAYFKEDKFFLLGIFFMLLAYIYHIKVLNKIIKEEVQG